MRSIQDMDVNEQSFLADVIERSRELPVVVDFWASWCGPCRQLGPVLEREVAARAGQVELAKVDVDANPRLAAQYGIQGIPAVKAFRDGAVVDEFVGALPPLAVQRFLDGLVPSQADRLVAAGDEGSLREALALEPSRADAAVALARILHGRGELEQALEVLANVASSFVADGLRARIELEQAAAGGDPAVAGERLRPALAALDEGDTERGLELLLELLPDADGRKDDLRRVIVGVLDERGAADEFARDARRRLASALY